MKYVGLDEGRFSTGSSCWNTFCYSYRLLMYPRLIYEILINWRKKGRIGYCYIVSQRKLSGNYWMLWIENRGDRKL